MNCDQCQMLSINGVACHEIGCQNSRKTWDAERGEWLRLIECRECGYEFFECDTHECDSFDVELEDSDESEVQS